MSGWVHDLGGADGFATVEVEHREPVFHSDWERRVYGLTATFATQEIWNTSEFRHAIERMSPEWYLDSSYYEHWLTAMTTLLVEKGVLEPDDVRALPLSRPEDPAAARSAPAADADPKPFAVGQRVRVRELDPRGHTRCPSYIRGHTGVVVRLDGGYTVPDVEAHTEERPREPTYSVRFDAAEIWGSSAEPGTAVCVDLWHNYLEAVE